MTGWRKRQVMIPAKEIGGELWISAADHHQAIKEALAQPEPVACLDCGSPNIGIPATYDSLINSVKTQPEQEPVVCKHEWFRTGAMEPRECRCIKCGVWNATSPQRTWVGLIRGVRVEGDAVVITVKGGNDAARELCGALLEEKNT